MHDTLLKFINTRVVVNGKYNPNAGRKDFWPPEVLSFLEDASNEYSTSISNKVYDYIHGFNKSPLLCATCNIPLKFETFSRPYKKFCSPKCSANNKETRTLFNNTVMNKYGTSSISRVLKFRIQAENTMLKRYGVRYSGQSKELSEKAKNTCISKYGITHTSMLPENRNKAKITSIEKYGTPHASQKHLTKNQVKLFNDEHFMQTNTIADIIVKTGYSSSAVMNQLTRLGINIPEPTRSVFEQEVVEYLHELTDDSDIILNDRGIISPYELDVYIPKYAIAIECNGDYWHSINAGHDKNKHMTKYKMCNTKNIKLFQIFEHQWIEKRTCDIWKSMIANAIHKNTTKIYARNCAIKEVNYGDSKIFLDENHLLGSCRSSIRIGLYYNDELVSLMTLGKSRFSDEIELLRFSTKKYTNVIGGGTKLLKFVKKSTSNLISYSDNTYSNGNFYSKCGFKYISETLGYFYIKNRVRYNRISLQKHRLPKLLKHYDDKMTADQNLIMNGFLKIYDAGQSKWKM